MSVATGLICVCGLTGVAPIDRVLAYPHNTSSCYPGNVVLNWAFSGSWSATDQTTWRNGVVKWDAYKSDAGTVFYGSSEVGGGIPVFRNADPAVNKTNCTGAGVILSFDIGAPTGSALLAHASAHEPGHAHGLAHDGGHDNLLSSGTSEPLMRGCFNTPTSLSSDDRAQISYLGGEALTPDGGFENGGDWIGSYTQLAGGYQGSYYAQVPASGSIYRPIRVTTPPATINMRAKWKQNGGQGHLKFSYRSVSYAGSSTCGGPYSPSNFDWNLPSVGSFVLMEDRILNPSAGWSSTSAAVPGNYSALQAVDVQITALSPTGQSLFLDNAEVY